MRTDGVDITTGDDRQTKEPHTNSNKSTFRICRWVFLSGLLLFALLGGLFDWFTVCEQNVVGNTVAEVCRDPGLTDLPVLAGLLIVALLISFDFEETSIAGIVQLRHRVEEVSQEVRTLNQTVGMRLDANMSNNVTVLTTEVLNEVAMGRVDKNDLPEVLSRLVDDYARSDYLEDDLQRIRKNMGVAMTHDLAQQTINRVVEAERAYKDAVKAALDSLTGVSVESVQEGPFDMKVTIDSTEVLVATKDMVPAQSIVDKLVDGLHRYGASNALLVVSASRDIDLPHDTSRGVRALAWRDGDPTERLSAILEEANINQDG